MMKKVMTLVICFALALSLTVYYVSKESKTKKANEPVVEAISNQTKAGKEIRQKGPFGSISLILAKNWQYELCSVNSSKLINSDYAIHIYPNGTKKGYIEIGHLSAFGVRGTNLKTKTQKIANTRAQIYYENEKKWDYILFSGRLREMVVMSHDIDQWSSSNMNKVMDMLDSLQFDPRHKSGAIQVNANQSVIESLSLNISLKNIKKDQGSLIFNHQDKQSLSFDHYLTIQKRKGTKWQKLKSVSNRTSYKHAIKANGKTEYVYNYSKQYGNLSIGDYRIKVKVTSNKKTYTAYVYFIIR